MNETNSQILYKVIPEISERWSPKSFSDKKVEYSKLKSAFEAARWAPSSYNEQPWRFILGVKNIGNTYNYLFEALLEKNKAWAQSAPVLVLVCCKEDFSFKPQKNRCAIYDTGTAVSHMVLQLQNEGVYTRQIAGLNIEIARRNFNIPDGYQIICMAAIGYIDDRNNFLMDNLPLRTRKDFDEFIFSESWNTQTGIL